MVEFKMHTAYNLTLNKSNKTIYHFKNTSRAPRNKGHLLVQHSTTNEKYFKTEAMIILFLVK